MDIQTTDEVATFNRTHPVTSLKVVRFFNAHPTLDFEKALETLVGMLETFVDKAPMTESETSKELRDLKEALASNQKMFVDQTRALLAGATTENAGHISTALSRNADAFVERLALVLPKTNEEWNAKLQTQIALVGSNLQRDFRDVFMGQNQNQNQNQSQNQPNKPSFSEFAAAFDAKLSVLQQPVLAVLKANQDTLAEKMSAMRDEQTVAKVGYEKLMVAMQEFLHKQGASSQFKGAASENVLEEALTNLFPSASVTKTAGFAGAGDFCLDRGPTLPKVLVENKNYAENVKNTEVQKFLRDVTTVRCSGVLLSQKSGIVGKRDFEVEIDNGNVLVYVHMAQDPAKITAAVAIIDALTARLKNIEASEATDGTFLPKEVLDTINAEVKTFVQKRMAAVATIKETSKRLISQVEDLHLPELSRILDANYASPEAKAFACEVCVKTFDSKRSLTAHMKREKHE